MHNRLLTLLYFLLPLHLFATPVELMYYDSFGDYISESTYEKNVDMANMSLAQLKALLEEARRAHGSSHIKPLEANLVIIGYGIDGNPEEFFAASPNVDNAAQISKILVKWPDHQVSAKWRVYFIDKYLSGYVTARKDHHWASPFRWLAQIGLQDLQYFR